MSTVLMYLEVVRLRMIFTVLYILPQVSEWSKYYLGPSEEGSVPAQLASALKLAHSGAPMKPSIHDPVTETLSLHQTLPSWGPSHKQHSDDPQNGTLVGTEILLQPTPARMAA